MIIRIILIVCTCLLLVRFLRQRNSTRTQAWGKIGAFLIFAAAVGAILFPEVTNTVARTVGVGRGADLLLYLLTMIFLICLLAYSLHRREDRNFTIRLARRLAIVEANQHPHNSALSNRKTS